MMRIYLQTIPAPERTPRFYHLILEQDLLEGWNLVKESGYQGQGGRIVKQHYASFDDALNALMKARDSQLKNGYRMVFAEGMENTPGNI